MPRIFKFNPILQLFKLIFYPFQLVLALLIYPTINQIKKTMDNNLESTSIILQEGDGSKFRLYAPGIQESDFTAITREPGWQYEVILPKSYGQFSVIPSIANWGKAVQNRISSIITSGKASSIELTGYSFGAASIINGCHNLPKNWQNGDTQLKIKIINTFSRLPKLICSSPGMLITGSFFFSLIMLPFFFMFGAIKTPYAQTAITQGTLLGYLVAGTTVALLLLLIIDYTFNLLTISHQLGRLWHSTKTYLSSTFYSVGESLILWQEHKGLSKCLLFIASLIPLISYMVIGLIFFGLKKLFQATYKLCTFSLYWAFLIPVSFLCWVMESHQDIGKMAIALNKTAQLSRSRSTLEIIQSTNDSLISPSNQLGEIKALKEITTKNNGSHQYTGPLFDTP